MMLEDKIFFNPGDLVILRHPIPNRPTMYVVGRVMQTIKKGANLESLFKGIRCRWYDNNATLQEAIFSTKDLKFYENEDLSE